jgi:hypothetical protein
LPHPTTGHRQPAPPGVQFGNRDSRPSWDKSKVRALSMLDGTIGHVRMPQTLHNFLRPSRPTVLPELVGAFVVDRPEVEASLHKLHDTFKESDVCALPSCMDVFSTHPKCLARVNSCARISGQSRYLTSVGKSNLAVPRAKRRARDPGATGWKSRND